MEFLNNLFCQQIFCTLENVIKALSKFFYYKLPGIFFRDIPYIEVKG